MTLQEANKAIHPAETQWHYSIMIAADFKCLTKEGTGMVRSYQYEKGDCKITCTTGVNSDHWSSNKGEYGYYSTLKSYVDSIK